MGEQGCLKLLSIISCRSVIYVFTVMATSRWLTYPEI